MFCAISRSRCVLHQIPTSSFRTPPGTIPIRRIRCGSRRFRLRGFGESRNLTRLTGRSIFSAVSRVHSRSKPATSARRAFICSGPSMPTTRPLADPSRTATCGAHGRTWGSFKPSRLQATPRIIRSKRACSSASRAASRFWHPTVGRSRSTMEAESARPRATHTCRRTAPI